MAISTIPNTYYEFAFNADPNQNMLPPYWQDLSSRVQFAWDTKRGKHYELDVNETGEWSFRLVNNDGALDPSNTGSVFAPNVRLFRQCRIRVAIAPTQNLAPRVIATGSASMDPVHDAVTNWWYPTGSGTIAQANYLTAAPSGQTTALAWTTPAATTSSNAILYDGINPGNATGPVADCVQVVAGQQYTFSRYLSRIASADVTVQATLTATWFNSAGTAVGSPSAGSAATVPTVTSWARGTVTGTAPAGAVWARVSMAITSPAPTTASNTIYVTGCQDEQAGAATSWADPGPTYFIITALAERLPQTWTEQSGTYGTSEPIALDALGALAVYTLKDPFINEVLALGPNFFYPLNDPKGSSACSDVSGKRIAAPIENSPFGAGSLTLGNSVTSAVASGLFLGSGGPVATFNNTLNGPGTQSAQTFVAIHDTTVTPGPPTVGAWTRIIAFRTSNTPAGGTQMDLWNAYPPSWAGNNQSSWWFQISPLGHANMNAADATGNYFSYIGTTNTCDGNWHFWAMSQSLVGGTITTVAYVDGVQVSSQANPGRTFATGLVTDNLGCSITTGTTWYSQGYAGDLAFAAEFPVALTPAQVTNLYNSFRSASSGESSGARYQRVLNWIGWTGKTRIDTGQTASMGPANDLTGATALDALNNIALTENGDSYAATDGALTFKARSDRYNKRTPTVTFGEGPPVGAVGEWPCEIAAIEYDPSHLANIVQVTQYQGPTLTAQDATSQKRYFPRTYQRTVNVTSPNEAQDAANYLLSQLKDPHLRADTIHLHPSAVPGLFAVCMVLEKGTRIRLNKRPPGAPTITVDAFIEKLDWSWQPDTGDVFLDLQASPADLANYWQLGALHTTLNLQAAAGQALATINALPDAAYNKLAQSLPSTYSLTFEPGTPRAETVAIAAGGIPSTVLGYTTAQITFAANLAFTHNAGTTVCEPLPTGYTDPTTWDASSVLGAASTTVLSGGASGTAIVTVGPLQDSKINPLGSNWNTGDTIWLSPGTGNFETATILSVATTVPGYTSCVITLTANLAHNHAGETVCDPLPAGITNPSAIAATTRLAY